MIGSRRARNLRRNFGYRRVMNDETTLRVKSNAVISKCVTRVIEGFKPAMGTGERRMMEVVAEAKAAGKAITIVEIAKRRIRDRGGKIRQMTRVEEVLRDEKEIRDGGGREHLQGEGVGKKKRTEAQIVIHLELDNTEEKV
jgi:hypothetical protein